MVTTRKILSNTFAQIVGKVGLSLLGFLSAKLVAVYLTLPERGHYEYAFNFLALAGTFADMGLYTIAIREYSKKEEPAEKVLGNILSIRNALSILVLTIALILLLIVPSFRERGPTFIVAVLLAGGAMMLSLLNGTITGVLQAEYKMKQASFSQVLGKILNILLMALGIFALFPKNSPGEPVSFWGFEWLYFAALLGNLAMYMYTRHQVKKILPIKYRFDWDYWKKLFKDAFPYGLALTLGLFYFKIDVLLIPAFMSKELADQQIAIYVGAVKILENVSIIPLFFLNALLPLMLSLIKEKNYEKLRAVIQSSFDLLFMMSAPLVIATYILAYPIIFVTNKGDYLSNLSAGFFGSDIILQIVIFSVFFSYLNLLFNFLLVAQGSQKRLIYINGLTLLFNLVSNILFIPKFGIVACAVNTVICEFIVLVCTYHFSKQGIEFRIGMSRVIRILIAALFMGGVLMMTKEWFVVNFGSLIGLALLFIQACMVYGIILIALKVINKDIMRLLKRTED
ncbi:MAG: flippase [Candidatus Gracilibacteria bacterium]